MSKSNTAANAALYYEAAQSLVETVQLTDAGDHKKFESEDAKWSERSGCEAAVRPNGLLTGGAVTPTSGQSDKVAVAALTCYLAGLLTAVESGDVTVARPASSPAGLKKIVSITVDSAGTLAAVSGTDGASFSTTRDGEGGPPLIPVGSIELAQVKLADSASAAVLSSEIFQVIGVHCERSDYPIWDEHPESGAILFLSALPLIHTGGTPKRVYAQYCTPEFNEISPASDFVPPETTHSQSSTPVYGGAVGSSSASLNQGSFKAFLKDGVTDNLISLKNEILWFKFYPDRNKTPHLIIQGKLGVARTFPAGDSIQANCTISAVFAAKEAAE